jgi:glycosyltransferase involved in cell wall biosynthesis
MKNKPRVSVVTPCYNSAATVRETLDSALAQTYGNIEIIAVNDGSKDETGEILASYGDRIKVLNQENAGQTVAKINGIAAATGDYIAFLDSDDLWDPTKIAHQVALMEFSPEMGVCYTAGHVIDGTGNRISSFFGSRSHRGECFEELLLNNDIVASSVMVRRAAIDKVGNFDPDLRACENWELWTRIASEYLVDCVDQPLTFYRKHGSNMSSKIGHMRDYRLMVVAKNEARYGGRSARIDRVLKLAYYRAHISFGKVYLGQLSLPEARAELARAIRRRPFELKTYGWYLQALLGAGFLRRLRRTKSTLKSALNFSS